MASTTFSGPVTSTNGFVGSFVGSLVAVQLNNQGSVTADKGYFNEIRATGFGNVIVIPTVDPQYPGAIWNNAGTLSISTG
jgi:hypothetical protein